MSPSGALCNFGSLIYCSLFDLARLTRGLPLPPLVALERAQAQAQSKRDVPVAVKNDPIDKGTSLPSIPLRRPSYSISNRVIPSRRSFRFFSSFDVVIAKHPV